MARLEKEVTHRNHSMNVSWVDFQAFLKVIRCLFQILLLQINYTDLPISLEVLMVIINNEFQMPKCFFDHLILMKDFAEAKVSGDAGWV